MKTYTFLFLFATLFVLSSCADQQLRTGLESVPECENTDLSASNIGESYTSQLGTIRLISLWVPVTTVGVADNPNDDVKEEHLVWVIMPDAHSDMIFEPCNLPEMQMIEGRRVRFVGQSLNHNVNTTNFEGLTPFNLLQITDGVEGPSEDDHSVMDNC